MESDCVKIEMEDLSAAMNLVNAYPLTDEQGYNTKPYRFSITNTCNVGVDYHVNLEVMDVANRMSSKNIATRVDEEEKKVLTEEKKKDGTYEGKDGVSVESYTLYTSTLAPGEIKSHSIRVWLDESAGNDAQNKSFYSKVVIEAIQNQIATWTLSDYLIGQSKSLDRSIIQVDHAATKQTGDNATTDYRYIGADPNNYVYFGCSDTCTEENLYRIIGVIPTQSSQDGEYENRVKLIKAKAYLDASAVSGLDVHNTISGKGYYWSGSNTNTSNDWTQSTLNTEVLNTRYWNSLGEYQNYIDKAKWYLGKNDGGDTLSSYMYANERGDISYNGSKLYTISNIGLAYASDYGYATSGGSTNDKNTCLSVPCYNWQPSLGFVSEDCSNND